MVRLLLISILLAACGPSATAPRGRPEPTQAPDGPFALNATYVRTVDGPALHFRLQWLARDAVQLYPYELPWGNPNSIELWARDASGDEVQVVYPIADPGAEALITLSPGTVLEGTFPLISRVPHITEALTTSAVVIMWRYPHRGAAEDLRGSVSGRVVIPRISSSPGAA